MDNPNIQLNRRELCLLLAGMMCAEDAPDAYRCGLKALGQPDAADREVVELGERILAQLDPDGKISGLSANAALCDPAHGDAGKPKTL